MFCFAPQGRFLTIGTACIAVTERIWYATPPGCLRIVNHTKLNNALSIAIRAIIHVTRHNVLCFVLSSVQPLRWFQNECRQLPLHFGVETVKSCFKEASGLARIVASPAQLVASSVIYIYIYICISMPKIWFLLHLVKNMSCHQI